MGNADTNLITAEAVNLPFSERGKRAQNLGDRYDSSAVGLLSSALTIAALYLALQLWLWKKGSANKDVRFASTAAISAAAKFKRALRVKSFMSSISKSSRSGGGGAGDFDANNNVGGDVVGDLHAVKNPLADSNNKRGRKTSHQIAVERTQKEKQLEMASRAFAAVIEGDSAAVVGAAGSEEEKKGSEEGRQEHQLRKRMSSTPKGIAVPAGGRSDQASELVTKYADGVKEFEFEAARG